MQQTQINDGFILETDGDHYAYVFSSNKKRKALGQDFKDHLCWYPSSRTQGSRKFLEVDHFDREVWGTRMWRPRSKERSIEDFGLAIQKSLYKVEDTIGGYTFSIRCRPAGLQDDMARAGSIGPDRVSGMIELGANRVNLPTIMHEIAHLICYPHANHGNAFGAAYLVMLKSFGFPMNTLSRMMGRNSLCFWSIEEKTNDRLRRALDVGKEVIP